MERTPSLGISIMGKMFMECVHIFVLSWKRDLTKGDYKLKLVQDIRYSIEHKLSSIDLHNFPKYLFYNSNISDEVVFQHLPCIVMIAIWYY